MSYYVYVYIDPRNYEEFYFGKGTGTRKNAHMSDPSDNDKTRRIAAITEAGLKPIIRVIARDLTEHDALLIEKTLLWKLGKNLTNVSSGHYSNNFRPHDKLHLELPGFDYQCGVYYYNVGEGTHRNWNDYRRLGFISAGQGIRWRDAMLGFQCGDLVAAYLKDHGYVGVGIINAKARPIREVSIDGLPMVNHQLQANAMFANIESDDLCEYVALVKWVVTVDRNQAKWQKKAGIYTTTHVRASLDAQPETVKFIEREFQLSIEEFVK